MHYRGAQVIGIKGSRTFDTDLVRWALMELGHTEKTSYNPSHGHSLTDQWEKASSTDTARVLF